MFGLSEHFGFLHPLTIPTKLLFPHSRLLAGSHADINVRRNHKPETFSHRGQVQVVDVIDLLQ